MSESLEDVYKANETWEQALMLGSPKKRMLAMKQLFYQKRNLISRAIWEREYFIGIAQ